MGELVVGLDDPEAADVGALLGQHLAFARRHSPPEDVHALDIAELKSMHTAEAARQRGVGRTMLDHLLGVARSRGCERVSLETGSMAAFAPARALYASAGFERCEPFAQYRPSPNSVFMTLELDGPARPDAVDTACG